MILSSSWGAELGLAVEARHPDHAGRSQCSGRVQDPLEIRPGLLAFRRVERDVVAAVAAVAQGRRTHAGAVQFLLDLLGLPNVDPVELQAAAAPLEDLLRLLLDAPARDDPLLAAQLQNGLLPGRFLGGNGRQVQFRHSGHDSGRGQGTLQKRAAMHIRLLENRFLVQTNDSANRTDRDVRVNHSGSFLALP